MSDYSLKERRIPLDDSWDVIVVGGGPAGCAAATASAREGANTLLIEASAALGGMGTLGLVPFFCGYDDGEKIIARGLAGRILEVCRTIPHVAKDSKTRPLWPPAIDPELLKRTYDDMVTRAGASVLFHTQLTAVEKSSPDRIDAVIVSNKSGLSALKASLYVDCTGDGDLAAWAGATFEKGDLSGQLQPSTLCFLITNVDDYNLEYGPQIWVGDPRSPIYKAVRSDKYPLIVDLHSCVMQVGPSAWGFNMGHVYDVDNTNPVSLSNALVQGRKMAAQYRDALAEFHPAFANSFLAATGALMGIRETRRVIGDYVLNIEDYNARRSFPDEICRNAYGIDVHQTRKDAMETAKRTPEANSAADRNLPKHFAKGESMGVPYRCLTPRGLANLLVAGRCISTDRPVNGTIRIMPCCLNTGEAAGLAAALALRADRDVHHVDTAQLRTRLKAHGAFLPDAI